MAALHTALRCHAARDRGTEAPAAAEGAAIAWPRARPARPVNKPTRGPRALWNMKHETHALWLNRLMDADLREEKSLRQPRIKSGPETLLWVGFSYPRLVAAVLNWCWMLLCACWARMCALLAKATKSPKKGKREDPGYLPLTLLDRDERLSCTPSRQHYRPHPPQPSPPRPRLQLGIKPVGRRTLRALYRQAVVFA